MRFATDVDDPVAHLADRFFRLVADGRGDAARGRHLYALRFLDAIGRPDHPLHLPYRPTRNPAAFLAMAFDLAGDALHGYGARLESGAQRADAAAEEVRRHLAGRLSAPWVRFMAELERADLGHLAALVRTTVEEALHRPAVSDLPAHLENVASWMTDAQRARFDADAFVRGLPLHEVLRLLRYDADDTAPRAHREQHATGGDLRALVRRRLDRPWRQALQAEERSDAVATLASAPFDVAWLAEASDGEDFAVAFALATDAHAPGRQWPAPVPYVDPEDREGFELLAGRGAASAVRREARLRRWGVSATFPAATEVLDERLAARADALPMLHAAAAWRAFVAGHRDVLEVARRRFVQQVADVVADAVADRVPA